MTSGTSSRVTWMLISPLNATSLAVPSGDISPAATFQQAGVSSEDTKTFHMPLGFITNSSPSVLIVCEICSELESLHKERRNRRKVIPTAVVITIEPTAIPSMLEETAGSPLHTHIRVNIDRRCREHKPKRTQGSYNCSMGGSWLLIAGGLMAWRNNAGEVLDVR